MLVIINIIIVIFVTHFYSFVSKPTSLVSPRPRFPCVNISQGKFYCFKKWSNCYKMQPCGEYVETPQTWHSPLHNGTVLAFILLYLCLFCVFILSIPLCTEGRCKVKYLLSLCLLSDWSKLNYLLTPFICFFTYL